MIRTKHIAGDMSDLALSADCALDGFTTDSYRAGMQPKAMHTTEHQQAIPEWNSYV
jgi:hypothetical protein